MSLVDTTLTDLAKRGDIKTIEDRWLTAIETGDDNRGELLEALAILNQSGKAQHATTLGWTWLSLEKDRREPADLLALARDLSLRCGDDEELRKEILRLYEEVHADRDELPGLLEVSGLRGGKTIRRALRTLEISLNLKVSDYLLGRSDEQAAEVTAIDFDAGMITVQTRRGENTLDPDALALAYDPASPNDFRVLSQIHPEKISELLESDTITLIVGLLQSHRGRLDSDELEHLLVPRFLPTERWSKWWTRTKTALKRNHNVVVEGRNPVILTYHAQGQTLEEEIEPQWARTETTGQRLSVIDAYAREAKARQTEIKPALIKRMHRDLQKRITAARKGSPAHALAEALALDRLIQIGKIEEPCIAREILGSSNDLVGLMSDLAEVPLYLRAAELIREVKPEGWPQVYADLLPKAPVDGCELIARALVEAGHRDLLDVAVGNILNDFTRHLDAVCWLWRGSAVEGIEPVPPRELLTRMLSHLSDLTIDDHTPPTVLRDARQKIRAAMSHARYGRYRQVITGMEAGLASTFRRTVDRLDGLGNVVRIDMLKIIQESHPQLYIKAKVDPWLDETVIYGTQRGMSRREEELNHLVNVKMKENAQAIGEAASHGDLSENSEYKFALEERDLLRARVAVIQDELSRARLITADDVETKRVNIGTRLQLPATDGSSRPEMTILGPWEADIERHIYNYRAPLCMKFRGLGVGDTVSVDLEGAEREYRIEGIENAL